MCGRALVSKGYEPARRGGRELPLECVDSLLQLLSIPLRSLGLGVLSLAEYMDLLVFLPWESQKQVGGTVSGPFGVIIILVSSASRVLMASHGSMSELLCMV